MALAGALKWSRGYYFFSGGQGLKWRARWDLEGGGGGWWSEWVEGGPHRPASFPQSDRLWAGGRQRSSAFPPAGTIRSTKRSKPRTRRLWLEAEVSLHNYTDVRLTVRRYSLKVRLFTFRNRRGFFSSRNGFFHLSLLAKFLSILKKLLNDQQRK